MIVPNSFQRATYAVWASPGGWIVSRWGMSRRGRPVIRRVRVDFETSGIEPDANLYGRYNQHWLRGEYIADLAQLTIDGVTVLQHGCDELAGVQS